MNIDPHCKVCGDQKVVSAGGREVYAFEVVYTGAPIDRVYCGNCGLIYMPKSIGCVAAEGGGDAR